MAFLQLNNSGIVLGIFALLDQPPAGLHRQDHPGGSVGPWWSAYEMGQRVSDSFDDVPDDAADPHAACLHSR